jgi:sulfur-carrier protein
MYLIAETMPHLAVLKQRQAELHAVWPCCSMPMRIVPHRIHGAEVFANPARCDMFSPVVTESAPNITIHVFGQLRQYCAGASELLVPARTVHAVLEQLERDEPLLYRNLCDETGSVRRHLNVFVNTENARDLDGVDTMLADGDLVTFLPAVSGG